MTNYNKPIINKEPVNTETIVTETARLTGKGIIVSDNPVNLRETPEVKCRLEKYTNIITTLDNGTEVEILETVGDLEPWYKVVTAAGIEGYVFAMLVEVV